MREGRHEVLATWQVARLETDGTRKISVRLRAKVSYRGHRVGPFRRLGATKENYSDGWTGDTFFRYGFSHRLVIVSVFSFRVFVRGGSDTHCFDYRDLAVPHYADYVLAICGGIDLAYQDRKEHKIGRRLSDT
jgi:hypothetical protein